MKRKLLFIGLLAPSLSFAQQKLLLTDAATKLPIANATAIINGRTLMADTAGTISLKDNKQVRLTVSAIGYQSLDTSLVLAANTVLQLRPNSLFLEPLEVKSVRVLERQPFTQNTLSRKDLQTSNLGADLPLLLEQTPSVVANSNAGNGIGYTGLSIRGTDATRINVTLNGIPYNDAESQGSFFVNIPDLASSAGSIQVQRGAGPSTNGSAAFGATINVSTNEFNDKAYGEINSSAGSFNSFKNTVRAGSGLLGKHWTTDVRLSQISSDGYVERSGSKLQSIYLSQAFTSSKTQVRLNIIGGQERTQQAWNGISRATLDTNRRFNPLGREKPGAPYEDQTDNYRQTHYQLFVNQKLSSFWNLQVASFYTRGKGYYEEYRADQEYVNYGINRPGNTDLIRQLWLDNHFYGQTFSLQYKRNRTEITTGGNWSSYDGKHYGKIVWAENGGVGKDDKWYDLTAYKKNYSGYVKWLQGFGKGWNAYADLQLNHVDYTMNGFRNNPGLFIRRRFTFLNPKAGLSWQRKQWNHYLSFAVAAKEPNRDDFEAGTTVQPQAEKLLNWELGSKWQSKKWTASANVYWMQYRNQLIVTGKINDVGAYTRVNVPESYRAGVELQAAWKPVEQLSLSGNLTLSRNKIARFTEFIDNYDVPVFEQKAIEHRNTDIALSPNVIGGFVVGWTGWKGGLVQLPGKYVGRQFLDNTQNPGRSINPYFVQDLVVQQSIGLRQLKGLTLTARVYNVFNKKYEATGYTFSYLAGGLQTENFFFPKATRNYMVGATVSL